MNVLRCGAKDYVTKDKLGTLPQIIERVMNDRRALAEQERMARELEAAYGAPEETVGPAGGGAGARTHA